MPVRHAAAGPCRSRRGHRGPDGLRVLLHAPSPTQRDRPSQALLLRSGQGQHLRAPRHSGADPPGEVGRREAPTPRRSPPVEVGQARPRARAAPREADRRGGGRPGRARGPRWELLRPQGDREDQRPGRQSRARTRAAPRAHRVRRRLHDRPGHWRVAAGHGALGDRRDAHGQPQRQSLLALRPLPRGPAVPGPRPRPHAPVRRPGRAGGVRDGRPARGRRVPRDPCRRSRRPARRPDLRDRRHGRGRAQPPRGHHPPHRRALRPGQADDPRPRRSRRPLGGPVRHVHPPTHRPRPHRQGRGAPPCQGRARSPGARRAAVLERLRIPRVRQVRRRRRAGPDLRLARPLQLLAPGMDRALPASWRNGQHGPARASARGQAARGRERAGGLHSPDLPSSAAHGRVGQG